METHAIAPLKFMPNEDATFGFWVMVCTSDVTVHCPNALCLSCRCQVIDIMTDARFFASVQPIFCRA